MISSDLEKCGEKFNLNDYISAQEKTKKLIQSFSSFVIPGMTEKDALKLLEKTLDDSGIEKRWHPTKLRMGINTLRSFREESVPIILKEEDIFFVDIGPVYFNHEGDFGQTFAVGKNPAHHNLAKSAESIFHQTRKKWQEENLTGHELYLYAQSLAQAQNLKLNTNMYGHRLGDFPHALYSREKLGSLNFSPTPKLWVLEIHLIDENLNLGAFFEDILT